jgi:hypothetical protein
MMRKQLLAGTAAVAALGSAGAVWAAGGPTKAFALKPNQAITYSGLTCTAYKGTTATNASIVCVRNNLAGFGVVVSQDSVVVAKRVNGKIKVMFKSKNQ